MLIRTSNRIMITTIAFFVMLMAGNCNAQFIRIKLEIPSTFDLVDKSDGLLVIDPPLSDQNLNLNTPKIRWLQIKAAENIEVIVSFRSASNSGRTNSLYLINDGTANFAKATTLLGSYISFRLHNENKTIIEMKDKPLSLSAWFGISQPSAGVLTIVYP